MLLDLDGMNHSTIPSSTESPADSGMIRTKHDESEQSGAIWTHFTAMDDFRNRVGIVKIRAMHVHDRLDSTHGALHHGCYLCLWEQVTVHSGRHVTDSRKVDFHC